MRVDEGSWKKVKGHLSSSLQICLHASFVMNFSTWDRTRIRYFIDD